MKNKILIVFLILIAGTFLSGYFGPWWAPAVYVVAVSALMGLTTKEAIGLGSGSLSLVFLIMTVYFNIQDDSSLIQKTGALLGGLSSWTLVVLSSFFGGLTGLLAGWVGSVLGVVLRNQ